MDRDMEGTLNQTSCLGTLIPLADRSYGMEQVDTTPRKAGRPAGQFERSRDQLWSYLAQNSPYTGTNRELGAMSSCSDKQVQRYLNSLMRDLDAIEVSVHRHRMGVGSWRNVRTIKVLWNKEN